VTGAERVEPGFGVPAPALSIRVSRSVLSEPLELELLLLVTASMTAIADAAIAHASATRSSPWTRGRLPPSRGVGSQGSSGGLGLSERHAMVDTASPSRCIGRRGDVMKTAGWGPLLDYELQPALRGSRSPCALLHGAQAGD